MSQLIIKNVKIHNFVHIEDADLELGPDIFFISGENRDESSSGSNGSGKSTLLQLIGWCLFEESPRKAMLKDGVIGRFDTFAQVVITLEKEGRSIIIDRVRNHPTRKHDVSIFIDGERDSAMHSKSDSNKFIESLLGISSSVFYYCTYADGDKEPLVALSSARLNQVVSEILDTQRFDTYIKNVRALKKDATNRLQMERNDLRAAESWSESQQGELEFLNQQIEDFDSERKLKIESLSKEIKTLKEELDSNLVLLDGYEEVETRRNQLATEVKKVDTLKNDLATLKNKQKVSAATVSKRASEVTKAEAGLIKTQENYDNIFNNASGSCNFCGNSLHNSTDLSTHSQLAVTRRDEAKATLIEAEIDLQTAKEAEAETVKALEDKENEIAEYQDLLAEFNKVERQLASLNQILKTVKHLDSSLTSKQTEIDKARKSTPTSIIQRKDQTVKAINDAEEAFDGLKVKVASTDIEIQACSCLEEALKSTKAGLFNSFMIDLLGKINANFDEISDGDLHCTLEQNGEELEILFTNSSKEGQYFPYWIFSRGEKAKISKAAAAALNEMMGVGLMIDDEGLDGVDDAGAGPLLDFIIKQNEGKSLFFVSHSSGVKDYFRGYKNIHVVKEDGRATIEVRNVED